MKLWVVFALSAALFWGAYVPTISFGQAAFGPKNPNAPLRAFLFIGLAYFVMAILVPGIWLLTNRLDPAVDPGFNFTGAWLSTLAGALGAAGALGVVFAAKFSRMENPAYFVYVAPIVFAGAPIINVLIFWLIASFKGEGHAPSLMFMLGIVISVVGVVMVLTHSPVQHGTPVKAAAPVQHQQLRG